MGFFNIMQEETVALPDKFVNSIVYPVSNGYYTVNIGQNISVNEGWNAIIVIKGKPRDIFPAGLHELSILNMPNTTRLLKLNQGKVKKGADVVSVELPQNFKCDLYYVNMGDIIDFPWKISHIPIRSKLYGKYKLNMNGCLTMHIVDSAKFISLLLMEYGHVKKSQGEKILSSLINEEAYDSILFSNFFNPRQFADKESINEFLLNKLNENFGPYGIKIDSVTMQDVKYIGKVNEQIIKENENISPNIDDVMPDKVQLDVPQNRVDDVQIQTTVYNQEYYPNEDTERQVTQVIKVKEKHQSMQDIQNEISNSLGSGSSRIKVTDNTIDKVKLNKKTKQ